jgi:hypothetical protein
MSTTEWHLSDDLARGYAAGEIPGVLAASVEQHLVRCGNCRALLAPSVDSARLDRVWGNVVDHVEAPRRTLLERILRALGVGEGTARIVAATPSLRGAWALGVVVVLTLAVLTAHADGHGIAMFLALAPVLPVVGVAYASGPATDPTHEVAAAAPYSALHLLAVRTAVVVASTLVPAAVAAPFLPGNAWLSVAWLLPALALTTGTLALATRLAPHVAGIGLTAAWLVVVAPGLAPSRNPLLAAELPMQLVSLAVLALSVGVLLAQRHDLSELFRRTA